MPWVINRCLPSSIHLLGGQRPDPFASSFIPGWGEQATEDVSGRKPDSCSVLSSFKPAHLDKCWCKEPRFSPSQNCFHSHLERSSGFFLHFATPLGVTTPSWETLEQRCSVELLPMGDNFILVKYGEGHGWSEQQAIRGR